MITGSGVHLLIMDGRLVRKRSNVLWNIVESSTIWARPSSCSVARSSCFARFDPLNFDDRANSFPSQDHAFLQSRCCFSRLNVFTIPLQRSSVMTMLDPFSTRRLFIMSILRSRLLTYTMTGHGFVLAGGLCAT